MIILLIAELGCYDLHHKFIGHGTGRLVGIDTGILVFWVKSKSGRSYIGNRLLETNNSETLVILPRLFPQPTTLEVLRLIVCQHSHDVLLSVDHTFIISIALCMC